MTLEEYEAVLAEKRAGLNKTKDPAFVADKTQVRAACAACATRAACVGPDSRRMPWTGSLQEFFAGADRLGQGQWQRWAWASHTQASPTYIPTRLHPRPCSLLAPCCSSRA